MFRSQCRLGRTRVEIRGRRCLAVVLVALASLVGLCPSGAAADPVAWEQWQHLQGVVDLAGPRSDGKLVVVAAGRLYLVSPDGTSSPFASGDDGYSGSVDGEPYLVVAPALPAASPECSFVQDDVYILDL